VHAFEVRQYDVTIKGMSVSIARMGHDGVSNRVFVVAVELVTAPRADLLESHGLVRIPPGGYGVNTP